MPILVMRSMVTSGALLFLNDQHGADFGFADDIAINLRSTLIPPHILALVGLLHVKLNTVTRNHGLAEFRIIDRHEVNELGTLDEAAAHAKRARRLGHTFNQKHAGHHRHLREVTLKLRLIECDILDANAAIITITFNDAIDQQEWIAMWQGLQQFEDVDCFECLCGRLSHSHTFDIIRIVCTRQSVWFGSALI